jgi:hypothetical protein
MQQERDLDDGQTDWHPLMVALDRIRAFAIEDRLQNRQRPFAVEESTTAADPSLTVTISGSIPESRR